jgi:hypothetical protein
MPNPPVEDLIAERAEDERKHAASGLSFAPIYAFVKDVAYMARTQERQAILDALPKAREAGRSESWNAGYDAAMVAIIRVLVERAHVH